MLDSLRHQINKAGSTTSFSSENSFPSASLSVEKLKPFINDSDNKQNENNVDATELILTSYVQQNKTNEIDSDSDG